MQTRTFGKTRVEITPITFGAMRIAENDRGVSDALLYALERGVTVIDTARNYGESERIVGQTLKEWTGERPFIASKVKPLDVSNWRFYVPLEEQFTPESIRESVETSLRTLDVDCIDLMQLHQWYYLWGQRPEWLETLKDLQQEGKIRYLGVSAQDHEHDAVLQLVDSGEVDGVQIVMNALESRPVVSLLPLAEQRGVGVVARCVFDHSGSLATGGIPEVLAKDVKLSNASPEIVSEYMNRIQHLQDDAEAAGMDLAELAVRFVLTHPGVSTLAVSLADAAQVDIAVAAAEEGPLPEDLFSKVCRDHIWVKNFYYFSKSTVDGNPDRKAE